MTLIAESYTGREIAEKLVISEKTAMLLVCCVSGYTSRPLRVRG